MDVKKRRIIDKGYATKNGLRNASKTGRELCPEKWTTDMPRKLDKSYALKNGRGFINKKQVCPENWMELNQFLCLEKWTWN